MNGTAGAAGTIFDELGRAIQRRIMLHRINSRASRINNLDQVIDDEHQRKALADENICECQNEKAVLSMEIHELRSMLP